MSTNSGSRTCLRDGFGGRDKRVRDGHDDIAGLDAAGHERKPQSVGAAIHCNGVVRVAEVREMLSRSSPPSDRQ